MAEAIPVVEVPDKPQLQRRRRPLAVPDSRFAPKLATIEAEVMVALADLAEESAGGVELVADGLVIPEPLTQFGGIGLEPGIEIDQACAIRALGCLDRFGHDVPVADFSKLGDGLT